MRPRSVWLYAPVLVGVVIGLGAFWLADHPDPVLIGAALILARASGYAQALANRRYERTPS